METLTRLVTESLARHGFDRPLDYRRLQWSRWFRCESHHSLLLVPSKPGVFALAEEVMDFSGSKPDAHAGSVEERRFSAALGSQDDAALAAVAAENPRMLAVTQFYEDDDMAFVLDRMLSHRNAMQPRLASGRYFIRYVVIEDQAQRRSVCSALNQWILSSSEKATGIGPHFATSLEFSLDSSSDRSQRSHHPDASQKQSDERRATTAPRLNSAVDTTIHCSSSFPSGF